MAATAANPFPYWQPAAGTDFSLGKMLGGKDVYKIASNSSYQDVLKKGLALGTEPAATLPPVGAAVPSLKESLETIFEFEKARTPYEQQKLLDTLAITRAANQQGFADAYPWVNQAAEAAAARNLRNSQTYRAFAAGLPGPVQDIMASKQAQIASAAGAEADRARAIAAQTQAAKDFAGRYTGQTFSVG